jgi:hypothetical protein
MINIVSYSFLKKNMKAIILFLILFGFLFYRNPIPIRLIGAGEKIVDTFKQCVEHSSSAPSFYYIRSSANLTIEIINDKEYINLMNNRSYDVVHTYILEPMISYRINLNHKYSIINGTCHIVTSNNNPYFIVARWGYGFPIYLKQIMYGVRDIKDNILWDE